MKQLSEIKSAKKRCLSMGSYHAWQPAFDSHPLAAAMDNYTVVIDVELRALNPDYSAILIWILALARKINGFCDDHKVVGNSASEYFLERFLWRADCVVQWDCLR